MTPESGGAERSAPLAHEGYWYCPQACDTPWWRQSGRVRMPIAAPPFLVVGVSLESVLPTDWPGELWRARVTELGDMSGLVAAPGYWRAREIELLEPLPAWSLFGQHGAAVATVLDRIPALTRADATRLAAALADDAEDSYSLAWQRWLAAQEDAGPHGDGEHARTLAVSGGCGSPINHGFMLIHKLLWQCASRCDGDAAFIDEVDEDGELERCLAPLWDRALVAAMHAAMALGAPEHLRPVEREQLLRPWHGVFAGDDIRR